VDLLDTLESQRRHVLGIVDGLSEADLRRPVLPSGWTCRGLINHLALDVERFWFGAVVAGTPETIAAVHATPNAWQVEPEVTTPELLDEYRRQIDLADTVIRATPLDAEPSWWPGDAFGGRRPRTHRDVLLHVITETACHAGHLDAARELLDGRQWLVLS
jgi:uncharacterized damage-inducible protein DinB